MKPVKVSILADDTARARGLLGEHGLAMLVDTGKQRLLFDTGQGLVIEHNAKALGARLDNLDAVVISHGHYDHTGGLKSVLEAAPRASVYLHPEALKPKYAKSGAAVREVGIEARNELALRARGSDMALTEGPAEVIEGVFATGAVPRRTAFEDTGGSFWLDAEAAHPDPLLDDQAIYFDSARGWVVLLGCAHAGVVNTLDRVSELTGARKFHAVAGGMHLLHASDERLRETVTALRRYEVDMVAPGHCTGAAASAYLRMQLPSQYTEYLTGSDFRF